MTCGATPWPRPGSRWRFSTRSSPRGESRSRAISARGVASIPAGANVSLGSPSSVSAEVQRVVEDGYRRVKIKIAPGADVAVVRAVRDAFPDVALSVDANGAYDLDREDHRVALLDLDAFGLICLEQPLAPGDLVSSAELCAMLETPVILDESIVRQSDFETAVALSALDGVSIKPARLGGVIAAKAMHDRAHARSASRAPSAACSSPASDGQLRLRSARFAGFDLPGDLGASDRYFVPDLTAPHVLVDGELTVPDGAGPRRAPRRGGDRPCDRPSTTVRVTLAPASFRGAFSKARRLSGKARNPGVSSSSLSTRRCAQRREEGVRGGQECCNCRGRGHRAPGSS